MTKKLFVGGISWGTTDEKLSEMFSQVGTVVSAKVITDRFTGKSKGFGFVEMSTEEEAEAAKQKFDGQMLDDRKIAVTDARPQQPRENNFQGGFGGGQRDDRGRGRDNRRNR